MPLLDRLFVVSDSGSGEEIGIGVILNVELLTHYAYWSSLVFRLACWLSC
jgi:hypothetical protein